MGGSAPAVGDDISQYSCAHIPDFAGMPADQLAATIANMIIAVIGVLSLLYYGAHAYLSTCGWEEVYVCVVELIKVFIEIFLEACVPVTFNITTGNHIVWVRYAEWLLTCPVILIHLGNLTGLADDYNHKTMALLVSDIGTIVMGITAAIASGYLKLAFFLLGLCYGFLTFKHAGQAHLEAYCAMPKGKCRRLVAWMALVFFSSWMGFPILFMLGQEGFFKKLTPWGSVVGHCIVDVLSKNLWGFLGHHLRIAVQEHIVEHGIVRVHTTHKILGLFELEVETLVDSDAIHGAVRSSMVGMAHRRSLQKVRSNLMARGHVCCDLDMPVAGAGGPHKAHDFSLGGGVMYSVAGGNVGEFIMPSQFLLGNPRWHTSIAGGQQRVHPLAPTDSNAAVLTHRLSRGASLEWPGKFLNGWRRSVSAAAGGPHADEGHVAGADGVAGVAIRSQASVGASKKE